MALWGISSVDAKNAAYNTAVSFGVATACYGVALLAKKAREAYFEKRYKGASTEDTQTYARRSGYLSLATGLVVAALAWKYIPKSGYGFINESSIKKVLALGVLQIAAGFVADSWLKFSPNQHRYAALGAITAAVGYFNSLSNIGVLGIGALGATVGAGYIAAK